MSSTASVDERVSLLRDEATQVTPNYQAVNPTPVGQADNAPIPVDGGIAEDGQELKLHVSMAAVVRSFHP